MSDIGVSLRELTRTRRRSNCPMVSFCHLYPDSIPLGRSGAEFFLFSSFLPQVYSMGTETRRYAFRSIRSTRFCNLTRNRPPEQYIPPIQEPYQYIIFRASEVKDLSVDDPVQAPPRRTHDDPAILAVSLGFRPSNLPRNPASPDENNDGCKRANLVFPRAQKHLVWINRCLPSESSSPP